MSSSDQHVRQANHNLEFLHVFFDSHLFNDWAITVGFYIAVHVIENAIAVSGKLKYKGKEVSIKDSDELPKVAARCGIPPPQNFTSDAWSGHIARNILIAENFPQISEDYKYLYRKSRTARYVQYAVEDNDVKLILGVSLRSIVNWSNDKLKTEYKLAVS
ncbi:MAG: hypothetical protein PHV97_02630 [Candidatus Omnitrophica bacterium]|nr:hypothetical protein [Candidatus Omnitrophota bacterium]